MSDAPDYNKLEADGENEPRVPESKPSKFTHNVVLCLVLTGVSGMADSLWAGTAIVAYLYIITNDSNGEVGYVEACQGAAMLLTALPIGYIADKYSRSLACCIGGVCNLIAAACIVYTVATDRSYVWLLGSMSLYGAGSGVISGPVQALYADSIPTGDRSEMYTYLFSTYLLVGMIGPAITIVIFQTDGLGDWSLDELRIVLYVGMGLQVVVAALLFFFDDKKALGKESEQNFALDSPNASGQSQQPQQSQQSQQQQSPEKEDDLARKLLSEGVSEGFGEVGGASASSAEAEAARTRRLRTEMIPWITFVASLLTALGSGMTIKFFPLFFKNECNMSPTTVQVCA